MFRFAVVLALPAALLVGCMAASSVNGVGEQRGAVMKATIVKQVEARYLIYLPRTYGKERKQWPLLLFLHGAGERGDDLAKVKTHGPPKLVEAGRDFPFILVSPQCPKDQWWEADVLGALLEQVVEQYDVDQERVCVTGLSMGGYGSWRLAAAYPNRFAAVAPVCGGGQPDKADTIAHLPIWVFHGAKDTVVPMSQSEDMVVALKQYGSDVKFTVYPDAGHDAWTATYSNEAFYDWLLAQRRPVPPAAAPTRVAVDRPSITLQAESMKLTGAKATSLPGGAAGVVFQNKGDVAETTVSLPAGGYAWTTWMVAVDGRSDGVSLEVDGRRWTPWSNAYGKIAASRGIGRMHLETDGEVTVRLRMNEPGVAVDRIVIEPLY